MELFEVKNLTKKFQNLTETQILFDINFKIKKGEFVSVMGPSGSGKSTILHILGFLLDYTDGQYFFKGKLYENYNQEEAAHVRNQEMGFVFQSFNLLNVESVYENVKLPLIYSNSPQKDWDKRIKQAIEQVGLTHRIHYPVYNLSGGEKQRVAIARALINNPSVIFADEPTGNLDSKSGQAVMETLQKLNSEQGHTVVLITHETTTAEHAERIIHIKDGRIESDKKVKNRKIAKLGYQK